jgi:Domain of unknown function (DUF4129)
VSTRRPVRAPSRGPGLLAAAAGMAGLLVVWAAAAPRPERVLPGVSDGVETVVRPPDEGVVNHPLRILEWDIRYSSAWVDDRLATVLGWVLVAVIAAAATLLAVVLLRAVLRAWRARRVPPPEDTLTTDVVPAAVLADQSERLAALGAGTPREGIVAAWARLEASIAIAGVPLMRSRTSTEVVLATLRSHDVPADTLEELAALFREARYSPHPLTEADRRRAEDAHRRVDAALERQLGLADAWGDDG